MDHKRRFWIWTAVVVVLIVLALCIASWKIGGIRKAVPAGTVVAAIPPDQLPAGFPVNIPIEQGALIVSNFSAATQNGQIQATRSFKSFRPAPEDVALYAGFLADAANGWKVVASSTDPSGGTTMVAEDNSGLLTIRVSPIPPQPMPASLVEITYVTNPPSTVVVSSSVK
jgi:hypothetical protein